MNAILQIDELTKSFSGVCALEDVSIGVDEGEVLALVGPNGSGKTTLFNCVTGFMRPTRGRIHWHGRDITARAPDQIARMGVVRTFQQKMVFPHTSVRENLEMAWQVQRDGIGHRAFGGCGDILQFLGLTPMADRLASDIPFGSARKLGVGLALAARPRLLLLDEPAAGLNEHETRELGELIARIAAELRVTVWVIEHDMHLVMSISRRVIVLHAGRKIAEGTPGEIAHDPAVISVYLGEKFATR